MTTHAARTAATRARILDAVRVLLRDGGFHDASMEAIAARAGVTRVTLYRAFGSKHALLQGLAWDSLAHARLDRVDAAHAHPDVRVAVREVLRANAEMFSELAEAMPLALELARYDKDMRAIIDATFHGRRHDAMERLAGRVVREGAAAPGWTKSRIADALLVLTSYEPYETLVDRRHRSVADAADSLYGLAGAFLAD
jgi:AcrR family transcriptional regulator